MSSFVLKWGKKEYVVTIDPATTTSQSLMEQVEELTGVQISNQKIMSKKGWKGVLSHKTKLSKVKVGKTTLSLMGSASGTIAADVAAAAAGATTVTFQEDVTPEERAALAKQVNDQALALAESNIPALQLPPGDGGRDDKKAIMYRYNYLVTGLPQRRIEVLLKQQRETHSSALLGECAMTLGAELGKAFIMFVGAFLDGTLVSARDDGRIQFWRHGERVCEVLQDNSNQQPTSPVTCLSIVENFCCTGGAGVIKMWNSNGECVQVLQGPPGTDPRNIVATGGISLASTFTQARGFDPHEFRLPPQNVDQERRRELAIEERRRQMHRYEHLARGVTVVSETGTVTSLFPWEIRVGGEPPPATSLAFVPSLTSSSQASDGGVLWVGDAEGCLRSWNKREGRGTGGGGDHSWTPGVLLQLGSVAGTDDGTGMSILGLETLHSKYQPNMLAASVVPFARIIDFSGLPPGRFHPHNSPAKIISTCLSESPFAVSLLGPAVVLLVDVSSASIQAVLVGHTDVVTSLVSLPNGDLLTGGGKNDATLKVWTKNVMSGEGDGEGEDDEDALLERALLMSQGLEMVGEEKSNRSEVSSNKSSCDLRPLVLSSESNARNLDEPGYVFDVCVLRDLKPESECFALGCARYNVVKICL